MTNIPASVMPAGEVITSYHDLWHVEASFRMSKSDLRARPIFHHTRESIEAHLTRLFEVKRATRSSWLTTAGIGGCTATVSGVSGFGGF